MSGSFLCFALLMAGAQPGTQSSSATDPIGEVLQKSFVWVASAQSSAQVYAAFRRTFDLADAPKTAKLHVFADSRYILWVNGRYVDRGPCRFDPIAPEYDSLDLAPHLRKGRNVLAVLVHRYTDGKESGPGDFCGRIMRHAPGLTVRLDVEDANGAATSLTTDGTWRASTKTRFGPSPGTWAGIPDNIDARRDGGDWTSAEFDDSAWEQACPIDGKLWGPLRARGIPLLRETEVGPLRLLEHSQESRDRAARWIWHREENYPTQKAPRWSAPEGERFFRRSFDLPAGAADVMMHATADNEFDCYFNGQKIGENHGDMSSWTTMQRMDATKYATAGRNTIAIRGINKHYGQASDPAGLLVVVTWKAGEAMGHLVSDASWRSAGAAATGWEKPDFDDSTWAAGLELCPYPGEPWKTNVGNYPGLRIYLDQTAGALKDVLPVELGAGHELVIDIGRMSQAYSVLDFEADEGGSLELLYAQRFLDTGRRPSDVYGQRNLYTARAGRQTYMSGDTFGFKYLLVRVTAGRIRLHDVRVVSRMYPFDCLGRFTCSDPALTRLWKMAVETIQVCSEDAYVDCAARERVEWMADGYIVAYRATQAALAGPGPDDKPLLGDPRLVRNLLRHIGQSLQPDGRLKAHHPSDRWDIHGYIEDYSCLWINCIREYYEHTGDAEPAKELWPAVTAQLKWFLDHRTGNGLVKAREFVYFGNPLVYQVCEGATLNAYVCGALRDAAFLAELVGDAAGRKQYAEAAEALARDMNEHLWDNVAGTYRGSITDGKKTPPTPHAAVACLYYGVVPDARRESVARWMLGHFEKEGFAPYTHQFLFDEMYRVDTDAADRTVLDVMRKQWATMLRHECGTVCESFGGGEYCHEAGAVPAYFLSAYVLGVRLDGPVWNKRILIEPRPGDLREAAGTVVTELGLVPVSWKRTDDGKAMDFHFEVPANVTATVSLPRVGERAKVVLDGQQVQNAELRNRHVVFHAAPGPHTGSLASEP